jgi:hypothetical protein
MTNNYIKENYRAFIDMLNVAVDNYPVGQWQDKEIRDGFKVYLLSDYILFLYELNNFSDINIQNPLYKQYQYSMKLSILCDRFKSGGLDKAIPADKLEHFIDMLAENLREFVNFDLTSELKRQEKIYYTKTAFSYKEEPNPQQQYNGRLAQLKEQAWKNNTNKLG